MKHSKRFLSLLLAVLLILTYTPAITAADNWVQLHLDSYWTGIIEENPLTGNAGYLLIASSLIDPPQDLTSFGQVYSISDVTGHKINDLLLARILQSISDNSPHVPEDYEVTHVIPLTTQGSMVRWTDAGSYITNAIIGAVLFTEQDGNYRYAYVPEAKYAPEGEGGLDLGTEGGGTINAWLKGVPVDFIGNATLEFVKASVPASGTEVFAGQEITYSVKVKNLETIPAEPQYIDLVTADQVYVRDLIPAGTTYVAGTASIDGNLQSDATVFGTSSGGSPQLTFDLGSLLPQQEKTISFKVTVDQLSAGANSGRVDNFAIILTSLTDDIGDNTNTVTHPITTGTVTINKYDGSQSEIDSDTVFYVKLTNTDGYSKVLPFKISDPAVFTGLLPGTYSYVEVADADGTALSGAFPYSVIVGRDLSISSQQKTDTGSVTNTLRKGTITINKTAGTNTDLTGKTFYVKLTGPGDYAQVKSFADGSPAVFTNLLPGSYSYQEVSNSAGDPIDQSTYTYWIGGDTAPILLEAPNLTGSASITNTEKRGEITVEKKEAKDPELAGVTFYAKLTGPDNYSQIKPFTTSSPAIFSGLKLGTYNLTEVADAAGTAISSSFHYNVAYSSQSITVGPDEGEQNHTVSITNTLKKGTVTISKVPTGNDNLAGITFYAKLTGITDPTFSQVKPLSVGSPATFNNLPIGQYKYEEVKNSDGDPIDASFLYVPTYDPATLTVAADDLQQTGTISNAVKKGQITVSKLAGPGTDLTDMTFYVKLTSVADSDDYWIKSFTTQNPAVFTGLDLGSYTVSEVANADGDPLTSLWVYNVDVKDTNLEVTAASQTASTTITNTIKTGTITINKLAAPGTSIDGITFYVKLTGITDPGYSMVKSFSVGSPAVFTDLSLGQYSYQEVDMLGTPLTSAFAYNVSVSDTSLTVAPDALNPSGSVTNQIKTGSITVSKLPGTDTILNGETFYVLLTKTGSDFSRIESMTESAPAVFANLPLGTYTIAEVLDSQGNPLPESFRYAVSADKVQLQVEPADLEDTAAITNTLKRIDISGSKIWLDQDDLFERRPPTVTINLYQNDSIEPYLTQVISPLDADEEDSNIWHFEFNGLPQYDQNNVEYTYRVSEILDPASDYGFSVDGNDIYNELITSAILLHKLDGRDGETPLAGAEFELWTGTMSEDMMPAAFMPMAYEPGTYLETLTTDDDGMALTAGSYPSGVYFLIETEAPVGFYPIEDPIEVYLTNGAIIELEGEPFEVTVYNDFIFTADISVTKTVANLTAGTAQADTADLEIDETAQYEVTITNEGNTSLDLVILKDDQVIPGVTATDQDDNTYIFEEGTDGIAYIEFGSMEPQQSIILTYEYTATAADPDRSPIVNTATVDAEIFALQLSAIDSEFGGYQIPFIEGWSKTVSDDATISVNAPPVVTTTTLPTITVTSESIPLVNPTTTPVPTITIVEEEIPQSGENAPMWPIGVALLAIAAGMLAIVHKSKKNTASEKNRDDDI